MPKKIVLKVEIPYLSILDEKGKCDETLAAKVPKEIIKKGFEYMLLSRIFDEKALALQRQGRIGTYASALGQEASQVGSALALQDKDWLIPSFRENAALITRKVPMHMLYQYWGGDERGSKMPPGSNNFPIAIPVGTQPLHAVGIAWGMKLKKEKNVAMTYLGDGATSEGDFHEAMNFAGVFHLPVIFLCQNNQYAISVPRTTQSAAQTLAQKAIAYGFEGIQVDGNDLLAVYVATKEAVEKARTGKGPTFIECVTYRISDHTTADDAGRYRDAKEVELWKKKDPLDRLRKYMQQKKLWTSSYEEKLKKEYTEQVEQEVKEYESQPPQNPEDIFNYTFAELTPQLKEQQESLKQKLKENDTRNENP